MQKEWIFHREYENQKHGANMAKKKASRKISDEKPESEIPPSDANLEKGRDEKLGLNVALERIKNYKDKIDVLVGENETLRKAEARAVEDKHDVVEFLRSEVAKMEVKIDALESTVEDSRQEKERISCEHRALVEDLVREKRMCMENAEVEQRKLKSALDGLIGFKGQKGPMENEIAQLKALLEAQEKDFRDRERLTEIDKLQKLSRIRIEMNERVDNAVSNFRKLSDEQMAETSKRAVRENENLTKQISYLSVKTVDLIRENSELRAQMQRLVLENEILQETAKGSLQKSIQSQKVVKLLVHKLDAKEPTTRKELESVRSMHPVKMVATTGSRDDADDMASVSHWPVNKKLYTLDPTSESGLVTGRCASEQPVHL